MVLMILKYSFLSTYSPLFAYFLSKYILLITPTIFRRYISKEAHSNFRYHPQVRQITLRGIILSYVHIFVVDLFFSVPFLDFNISTIIIKHSYIHSTGNLVIRRRESPALDYLSATNQYQSVRVQQHSSY